MVLNIILPAEDDPHERIRAARLRAGLVDTSSVRPIHYTVCMLGIESQIEGLLS